jgi:hypothetical protein
VGTKKLHSTRLAWPTPRAQAPPGIMLTCEGCRVQGKQLTVVRSRICQRPLPQPDRRQPFGDPAQRFDTYRGVGDCRK